jgi:metal-responsive CopG/Arc/MetJ family transcriptional regulator
MRHKIPDDMKKEKVTLTIDERIMYYFSKYLDDNNISNKSKYIENLIRKDMEERGENITRKF